MSIGKYPKGVNAANYRHGGYLENKPEYNSWRGMRERCNKSTHDKYKNYGGRGIRVCPQWDNNKTGFITFLNDMGKKPSPSHSIDRINSDGDYEPSNCRWATQSQQLRNSSRSRKLTINGETRIITDWLTIYGISSPGYYERVRSGMNPIDAMVTPLNQASGLKEYRKKVSAKALSERNECLRCGKKVKLKKMIYCSRSCYFTERGNFRGPNGKFTSSRVA